MNVSHRGPGGKWQRTSRERPCPVCGRHGWCSLSLDGSMAACRRVEASCWKSKTDKSGTPVYLHRLDGTAGTPPAALPAPSGPAPERADPDTLHAVYSALLAALPLSNSHREGLHQRGLTDAAIDRAGYGTLHVQGRARVARGLRERFGDTLLSVPGFVVKPGTGGSPYLTLAGAAGLLVPVRDPAGRIVASLVRRDDASDGRGKYSFLSSAKYGGPGPGTPAHVPLGIEAPAQTVRLTEGALKADIAFALSGLPTVGAAGLAWRLAFDALQALGCKTVRLAFDADSLDNAHVARALAACQEALDAAGLALELERWDKRDGKGIDDLLAGSKVPEVLTGEAARAAICEALTEATAGEPLPEPGPLDRLAEVLANGGAPALFADRPLLEALARLAAADHAAFLARRATLKGLVSVRDLDAALKPFVRDRVRERPPVLLAAAGYRVSAGCLVRQQLTPNGPVEVPLCNFTARITEVVTRDDGAEQTALFTVAGVLADGRELPPVPVPAADFAGLGWVTTAWHGEAVMYAGLGTRDHLRAAIELLSPDRTRRTIYAHTGWRRIGDSWHYLHAGGAIGADGLVNDVPVSLPEALANFRLPAPPESADLAGAIRASLGLLRLGPDRATFPLLMAVYRSVLGDTDFGLFLAGPTGCYKTEAAALAQQHFGAGLDARHLPANWSSTSNALEGLAFVAKDALLVVDDFCPTGSSADLQRYHREADRLFRGQGNHAGRQRMRADATLRPEKPPRGLILATGEDTPRGQSLGARILTQEVSHGDFGPKPPAPNPNLTACQKDAAAGMYAAALAAFLRWVAPQFDAVRGRLRAEAAALRDQATAAGQHARTPGIVGDLTLGLRYLLDFAHAAGAVTESERADLWARGWSAITQAAADQAAHIAAAEPTSLFLRLVLAALGRGSAHVATPEGTEPANAAAWGWRLKTVGAGENTRDEWQPQGTRIGWLDDCKVYLSPEAAYAEANSLAGQQGGSLPVSPRTLHKRLHEGKLLAAVEKRGETTRYVVRKTLEGQRREVLCLLAASLSPSASAPSAPNPQNPQSFGDLQQRTSPVGGALECATGALGNAECAASNPEKNGRSEQLAHLAHSDAGGEALADGHDSHEQAGAWGDWQ